MDRLHTQAPGVHAWEKHAPAAARPPHTPAGEKHAPAAGATWWQLQGVSKRCGVDCTAQRCHEETDERNRYWPDCPHSVCPSWKAAALGVVGLSDHEQVHESLRPLSELTPDQVALLVKLSHEAGLEARTELWRRNGVQP